MPLEPIIRDDTFTATPDEVFDAFTVPSQITRWFAQHAETDVRPGGWWTFNWPPYLAASGRYLTVDRPNHLEWTWDASIQDTRRAPEGGETHPSLTLDYTFTTLEDGKTALHIEERGHTDDHSREMSAGGIDDMLSRLHAFLEHGQHIDWTAVPPATTH